MDEKKPLTVADQQNQRSGAADDRDSVSCMDGCSDCWRKFLKGFRCRRGRRNDTVHDGTINSYKYERKLKGQMNRRKSMKDT